MKNGNEKRLDRLRSKTKLDPESGCLLWTGARFTNVHGKKTYGMFHWGYEEGGRRRILNSQRAAWILAHGEPGDAYVLHTCHNMLCCNIEHLYLGDHLQNMVDRDNAGRTKKGADHYYFKCTPALILALKVDLMSGLTVAQTCKKNGISWGTMYNARDANPDLALVINMTKSARYSAAQKENRRKRK